MFHRWSSAQPVDPGGSGRPELRLVVSERAEKRACPARPAPRDESHGRWPIEGGPPRSALTLVLLVQPGAPAPPSGLESEVGHRALAGLLARAIVGRPRRPAHLSMEHPRRDRARALPAQDAWPEKGRMPRAK